MVVVIMEPGQELPGGFVSRVTRVGDTVHRTPGPGAPFVHRLLQLLADTGWTGAPRLRGTDADGREVLDFVSGPLFGGELGVQHDFLGVGHKRTLLCGWR